MILRVPKAKIAGSPSGFPGGPADTGPGHVGGAGLDFDSAGNLYLGVGDDVAPGAQRPQQLPADGLPRGRALGRAQDVARTPPTCAARSSASRRSQGDIPADAEPGVGATYTVPAGNLFPVGTAKTRPEIYAMGFRQPFTLHTDPKPTRASSASASTATTTRANQANRSPAGTCEWNLINQRRQPRLAVLRRRQLGREHDVPLELRDQRDDGPAVRLLAGHAAVRHPLRARPARPPVEPTFDGLDTLPGPVVPATIWKKYDRATATARPTSVTSARAACSRSPARSTATTRPPPARAPSRATTTAPG